MKNKIFAISSVVLAVLLLVSATIGLAAVPGGAEVTLNKTNQYTPKPAGSHDAKAGEIYQLLISGEMSTYHWAGIYGNATGKLVLASTSGQNYYYMYNWSAKATYVIFDDDTISTWSFSQAACSDVAGEFSFVGTGPSDSCANTFNTTGDVSFKSINSVSGTILAQTYNNAGTAFWKTFAVKKSDNDVAFVAEVVNTGSPKAYNGDDANFQAILPENGEGGDTSATTYYIWIELY